MALIVSSTAPTDDDERRRALWDGVVYCTPPRQPLRDFVEFAWHCISEAFGDLDPMTAHDELPVERYVALLGPLKTGFTHHPESKRLLALALADQGCDLEKTYFDVPKLRTVSPAAYLNSGLGYNYKPHRDTWYSSPQCQVNWWAPIRGVTADACMAFHPDYFSQPAPNTSDGFDAYAWNATSRRDAAKYITSDPRPHPTFVGGDVGADVRILPEIGSTLIFSGAHLHATVPNTTARARFSVDFRTVHIDDLRSHAGPAPFDRRCTGTTLRDFHRADTLEPLPDELIAEYDVGGTADGVLVFDPTVLEKS